MNPLAAKLADEIMPLANIPDHCKPAVRTLIEVAYLEGRVVAMQEEIKAREAARERDAA